MKSRFGEFWKSTKEPKIPKVFQMIRNGDESGTSGTGKVLDGVIFPSGKVVICWDPDSARVEGVNSVSVFDSFEQFHSIHIGQHTNNGTEIHFLN